MPLISPPLRVDSERMRRKILDCATYLCREAGYEHVRMADVADCAGCSRATVYNHFPTRDVLLEALCVEFLDGYLNVRQDVIKSLEPDATVFDVLRETVVRELRWRISHWELRGALDSAKRLRTPFYVEAEHRIDDAMLAWFSAIYESADRLGLIRDDIDVKRAARPIYAMMDSVVAEFSVNVSSAELERAADQVALLQWHALFRVDPQDSAPFSAMDADLHALAADRPIGRSVSR